MALRVPYSASGCSASARRRGAGAATAVLTVLFASFGPLVALQLLIAPVLGLVALGRPKQLRRRSTAPPGPAA